ncbi:MAG TPA: hypothetical protein VFL99_02265 [Segeticoccus sp.]|uniref:hypothetical protein n=1 Tax=Segeticoccus sp. TaxID=2706531 RepID=UPI002D7EDD70|nr:hypothetical protein [Segeticoccus sp.]HET8599121.1 hypothetical protein [Segeticoccus sp.]
MGKQQARHVLTVEASVPTRENPAGPVSVTQWIAARVARDDQMRQADAARDAAPGEKEIPDRPQDVLDVLARDHNQVKAMLEQLSTIPGKLEGDQEKVDDLVEKLTFDARTHVAYEERVFLDLVQHTSAAERQGPGERVRRARGHAPTTGTSGPSADTERQD